MEKVINNLINHLTPTHLEGWILYLLGAGTITAIHIINAKVWKIGLAGDNKMWEGPEMVLYICSWIFPHMILSDGFLGIRFSDFAWYTIWALTFYGLAGRFGLQWLLAMKTGQPMADSNTKVNISAEIKNESN